MRSLRGSSRRPCGEVLHHACAASRRRTLDHDRGIGAGRRSAASDAGSVSHASRAAVWLCTPGMIMTAIDLVNREGNELDEQTIRSSLEGNLCRCTGYHNIVKAIGAGARAMKGKRKVATA